MEINRIEADRHLIGVGRELESLDGKAKATLPVHVTEDGLRFFKRDPEGEWERLYDAEQAHLTVGTLQAVVDYLNQNPDGLELDKLLVHVCDVTTVRVMSVPFGGWKQRTTYMRADAVVPIHRFGSWISPDEFVPYLQSCFVPSDDLDALIKISGNLVDTSEVRVQDDGVSQEVSIRQGAARKAEVPVPSPAVVFPFSTFAEVAQPAHKVVFRLQSSPLACKLIECDGGAWKLEAIANIRTWLIENLPEGVKVIA